MYYIFRNRAKCNKKIKNFKKYRLFAGVILWRYPDPYQRFLIRIRIRPNDTDPTGSGSGSETLNFQGQGRAI